MKCPSCNETLLMSDKKGIEIDYCPSCRGIWLDRGELEKIIDRSTDYYSKRENYDSNYKPFGDNQYSNDNQYGNDYKRKHPNKKKKSSFLGDLFDL